MPDSSIRADKSPNHTWWKNIYLNIFVFFLLVNILVTGGRLASSDETAIFLLTESMAMHGTVDVPAGIIDNGTEANGKFYIWYEVGQSLVAVPFYWGANAASGVLHLPPELKTLFTKAAVGVFNGFIGAGIAVLLFAFAGKLGYSTRTSLLLCAAFGIGTFAFPYFKSFLREPLLTFYLLASCYFLFCWRKSPEKWKWALLAGIFAGLGFLTKVTFAVNIILFACYVLYFYWKHGDQRKHAMRSISMMVLPVVLATVIMFWYNYARFNNPFDLGYKGGTSFSTPFYVGFFGLMLSPGKSFFLYAPIAIIGIGGFRILYKKFPEDVWLWLGLFAANIVLYGNYVAWGSDGSWGPRYLVPLIPFFVLAAGIVIEQGTTLMKRASYLLIIAGIVIQIGGTSVYIGTYLREMGEYPYTRNFDDPEFLYKTHFIPNYSPVIGQWRMTIRNIGEHLSGDIPSLKVTEDTQSKRIPLAEAMQAKLQHTLDYWFLYPRYVGYRSILLTIVPLLLLLLAVAQWMRLLAITKVFH